MYLTASPCYTTVTNKHDFTADIISTNKQLINAVTQRYLETDRQANRQTETERQTTESTLREFLSAQKTYTNITNLSRLR